MLIAGKINTKLTLGELLYLGFSLGALCVCIINPINNYLFYLYLSILVYVYIFALTVRYRNFSLYQIFLISYFAFLEARIFLNAFGSFDVRTLDAFGNNIMSNEVASETLRTIIVFLIGTSYAWLLLPKNEENRYYEKTLQINGMINSVLKALYYIYFIIFLLKMYFIINLVRTRGYLSVFNGTLSDYDLPIIFWGSGTIIELLFLILIYYNRDELSFRRYSILFLIIGVISLFAIFGFWGYEIYKKYYTKKEANGAVEEFNSRANAVKNEGSSSLVANVALNVNAVNETPSSSTSSTKLATMTYKGFTMLGTIEIPKISLSYPVLDRASAPSMKVSVGVAYGPGLNKVGNTVIMGHNYRDGTFFSNLYKLSNNDEIYITDETGTRLKYLIYNIYETSSGDFEYASRDTAGKREISLSTCTDDVSGRIIVWAKEAE